MCSFSYIELEYLLLCNAGLNLTYMIPNFFGNKENEVGTTLKGDSTCIEKTVGKGPVFVI